MTYEEVTIGDKLHYLAFKGQWGMPKTGMINMTVVTKFGQKHLQCRFKTGKGKTIIRRISAHKLLRPDRRLAAAFEE